MAVGLHLLLEVSVRFLYFAAIAQRAAASLHAGGSLAGGTCIVSAFCPPSMIGKLVRKRPHGYLEPRTTRHECTSTKITPIGREAEGISTDMDDFKDMERGFQRLKDLDE
jgi:hypothetical protein